MVNEWEVVMDEYTDAIIRLKVPSWQIGEKVRVFFPDSMVAHGKCEADDVELLTDKEQRIFLKAMSREREVCPKVDDEFADDDANISLVRVCNEIERKVKKIWE